MQDKCERKWSVLRCSVLLPESLLFPNHTPPRHGPKPKTFVCSLAFPLSLSVSLFFSMVLLAVLPPFLFYSLLRFCCWIIFIAQTSSFNCLTSLCVAAFCVHLSIQHRRFAVTNPWNNKNLLRFAFWTFSLSLWAHDQTRRLTSHLNVTCEGPWRAQGFGGFWVCHSRAHEKTIWRI